MVKLRMKEIAKEREKAPVRVLMIQSEVARMMGLSRERVRQMTLDGQIEACDHTVEGRPLFDMADVKKLMERRELDRK